MKKFFIFLTVCLSVILISCSRPADALQAETVPVGEHVFNQSEILEMLTTNGVVTFPTLTDAKYVAPTLEWIEKQYSDKLTQFLFAYNLNHWTEESFDCDDISRAAAVTASVLFHNSKSRIKGAGLLFGEYHYIKAGVGGHAINVIIVKDKDIYRVVFYEPQKKFIIKLSDNERASSLWYRF